MAIKAMLTEIKTSQMKDTITNEVESIAKINSVQEKNNEMASEIAFLKATISQFVRDNESMREIFDLNQNEWVKVESKPRSTIPTDSISTTSTGNRLETFIDENNENLSNAETDENINAQIQDYRLKQQSNFKCRKNNKQKETRNHPNAGHTKNTLARKQTTEVKKVLVIRWSNTSIGRKSKGLEVASQLFPLILVQRWNKSMRRFARLHQ